jgi:hypothetical protein
MIASTPTSPNSARNTSLIFVFLGSVVLLVSGGEKLLHAIGRAGGVEFASLPIPLLLILLSLFFAWYRTHKCIHVLVTFVYATFFCVHLLSLAGIGPRDCNCFPLTMIPTGIIIALDGAMVVLGGYLSIANLSRNQKVVRVLSVAAISVLAAGSFAIVNQFFFDSTKPNSHDLIAIETNRRAVDSDPESTIDTTSYRVMVKFMNRGDHSIEFRLESTCDCQSVPKAPIVLAPSDSIEVEIGHLANPSVLSESKDSMRFLLGARISRFLSDKKVEKVFEVVPVYLSAVSNQLTMKGQ